MKGRILLALAAAVLAGCLFGCAGSDRRIEYRRSGGFAGFDDRLVIAEDGKSTLTRRSQRYEFTLDEDSLKSLQGLFETARFSQLSKEYLPSQPGADLFEYILTYQGHTVRTLDGAVPEALQPILEALNRIVADQGQP